MMTSTSKLPTPPAGDLVPDPSIVNFFVAGCPRCGTTWLHAALSKHPEIYLPARKQTYFFDTHYEKGLEWYMESYADVDRGHKAVGEVATGYSQAHALPRLAEYFPHARILLAMRDPAERAYSFYRSRSVVEGWRSFREAAETKPEILEQGKYIEQIEHILEFYPQERLLLLFYDDLEADDRSYLRRVLEFLEVDPDYESEQLGRMVQVAAFPRTRRLLHRARLDWLADRVSSSPVGDLLRRRLKSSGARRYPPMDDATREFLRDYYRPYNERLAAHTGRDLSKWFA